MKTQSVSHRGVLFPALALALSITGVCTAQTTPPDFTTPDGMASAKLAMQRDFGGGNIKTQTYNLGPTGLRGRFHLDTSKTATVQITDTSRQILVTHASTPGSAVIQVDDVILGATAASSGTVPSFTSDARKAFGTAISNAEKTGAGTLRVKRWRAGTTTDVNITIPTLGTYSATAPYNCPKSTLILTKARDHMVGKLLADANYLSGGHAAAINALALLASVEPSHPNYAHHHSADFFSASFQRSNAAWDSERDAPKHGLEQDAPATSPDGKTCAAARRLRSRRSCRQLARVPASRRSTARDSLGP